MKYHFVVNPLLKCKGEVAADLPKVTQLVGARVGVCSSYLTLKPNFLSRTLEGTIIFSRVYSFLTRF